MWMSFLSDAIIPILIFLVLLHGVIKKRNVYEDFLDGAKDGFFTVIKIMPTLIGLMVAVGMLRASGFLDYFCTMLSHVIKVIPAEILPVAIIKMFSSSAATGLVLDIFKEYGTDSYYGKVVSIMGSCTETIFYTVSVYFMSIKIKKTRWTIPGALLATLAGIIASLWLGNLEFV